MNKILKKYHLSLDVKLVRAHICGEQVDAFFENETHRFHRCISLEDLSILDNAK